MATSLRQAVHKNLECPVCLGFFKDPKILTCSHTFCKVCLDTLLQSHPDKQSLSCPVCRGETPISGEDVGKLPTSKALISMIADVETQEQGNKNDKDLKATGSKGTLKRSCKCEEHSSGDEECFCVSCGKYVCYRCGVEEHVQEGHKVITAEVHRNAVRESVEELVSKAEARIGDLDKYISSIAEERERCKKVGKQLNNDVNKAYEELIVELIEHKAFLKSEGRKRLEKIKSSLQRMEETSLQHITRINAVCELVRNGLRGPLENVSLNVHNTLIEELKLLLSHTEPKEEQLKRMTEETECLRFERHKGTKVHMLGCVAGVSKWKLIADEQLPTQNSMNGLAASPKNAMLVGCKYGGILSYTANGLMQGKVLHNVRVRAFQYRPRSDGCYIVRKPDNSINQYTSDGKNLDRYFCTKSHEEGGCGGLDVDQDGQILISYTRTKKIEIFQPDGWRATREIQCDEYEPHQIFAMSTSNSILVKGGLSTVLVIDSLSGATMHSITQDDVSPYPCLGKNDTILIAWVNHKEGKLNITHYTKELKFMETVVHKFKFAVPEREWYYLQRFTGGEIAFCTPDRLFIFRKKSG